MAVCEIRLSAQNALQRMASFVAIIPEKTSEPFPVVYLLHGLSDDVPRLVERADRSTLPALWIDCGTEDFLIDQNRRMHAHLNSLGISHHYSEHPGAHTWDYWDARIQEALEFLRPHLGL